MNPASVALVFTAALVLADLAAAQDQETPIVFEVQIVHASNAIEPAVLDPACKEMARVLPVPFTSMQMVARERIALPMGKMRQLSLPTGRTIRLLPISVVKNRLHLHFQMQQMVDTRLQLQHGRSVIVGGEPYMGGQIIIMVKPDFRNYLTQQQQQVPQSPQGPQLHRVGHSR